MMRRIEIGLLSVLLTVVGLRPLIDETLTTALDPVSAAMSELASPRVARTLLIDLVALVASAIVLLGAMRGPRRAGRRSGLEWGTTLFAVAALMSCFVAGEKRPAINAALDWMAALVTAAALVRLLDEPWRIVLALGVIVGSAAVNVADCVDDRLHAAETRANYLANREAIWGAQGIPSDSVQVELFERRMAANEASGFFAHSNVAGGYLLLGLFAALGAACATGPRSQAGAIAGGLVAAGMAIGIVLTRGTGALVCAILGMVLLAVRGMRAGWMARHRRVVFALGWGVVMAGAIAVCTYGLMRGTLPNASLAFRWQYWTASAEMFRDHGLIGVGGENYGHHYTTYKTIASSEEVKNPHNFLVQFATEYGVVGLAAALVMLVAVSWRATEPVDSTAKDDGVTLAPDERMNAWCGACALVVLIFAIRIPLLESLDPHFVYYMTAVGIAAWFGAVALVLMVVLSWRDGPAPALAGSRGRSWLAAGACVGLLMFLVQDMINFALFVPAARMSFLTLVAVVVALRRGASHRPAASTLSVSTGVLGSLALVSAVLCAWQLQYVVPAGRALAAARAAEDPVALRSAYQQAIDADPFDATAAAELAQWALRAAGQHPESADAFTATGLQAVAVAIARNPDNFGLRLREANLHLLRGRSTEDAVEFDRAVDAGREATRLYPAHPPAYVTLGDCWRAAGDCRSVRFAVASYEHALALDNQRPDWEILRRFNPRERGEIEARVAEARAYLAQSCSAPP